jgi:hypothetical protein
MVWGKPPPCAVTAVAGRAVRLKNHQPLRHVRGRGWLKRPGWRRGGQHVVADVLKRLRAGLEVLQGEAKTQHGGHHGAVAARVPGTVRIQALFEGHVPPGRRVLESQARVQAGALRSVGFGETKAQAHGVIGSRSLGAAGLGPRCGKPVHGGQLVEVIKKTLQVKLAVGRAHPGRPRHPPAVAQQAVHGGLAHTLGPQPHGQAIIGKWRFYQPVTLAHFCCVVGRRKSNAPREPQVVQCLARNEHFTQGALREHLTTHRRARGVPRLKHRQGAPGPRG